VGGVGTGAALSHHEAQKHKHETPEAKELQHRRIGSKDASHLDHKHELDHKHDAAMAGISTKEHQKDGHQYTTSTREDNATPDSPKEKKGLLKKIFGSSDKTDDKDNEHVGRDVAVGTAGGVAAGEAVHTLRHKHQDVGDRGHSSNTLDDQVARQGQQTGVVAPGSDRVVVGGGSVGSVQAATDSDDLPAVPITEGKFMSRDATTFPTT
jgi:hypothetical protein